MYPYNQGREKVDADKNFPLVEGLTDPLFI